MLVVLNDVLRCCNKKRPKALQCDIFIIPRLVKFFKNTHSLYPILPQQAHQTRPRLFHRVAFRFYLLSRAHKIFDMR